VALGVYCGIEEYPVWETTNNTPIGYDHSLDIILK